FVRYVPMVAARGGKVILECYPELQRLLAQIPGVERLVTSGADAADAELQCPLLSLPLIFGTKTETVPRDVPYLRADPAEMRRWQARMPAEDRRLKVGL